MVASENVLRKSLPAVRGMSVAGRLLRETLHENRISLGLLGQGVEPCLFALGMRAFADHADADQADNVFGYEGDVTGAASRGACLFHWAEAEVFAGLAPLAQKFAVGGGDGHG